MTARWQQKRTQPNHTDDWLMTYADMITLLLCFFAIIIIMSVAKKHVQPSVPVPPVIEQQKVLQEKMPTIFADARPFRPLDQIDDLAEAEPEPLEIKEGTPVKVPVLAPIVVAVPLPPVLLALLKDDTKSQGPTDIERKGDRITTLELNSAAFFDSGSATLSDAGKSILLQVAQTLKSDQFEGYRITVEGHTDDTPIHTVMFSSNWELSTARASAVVHFFLEQGLPASHLRAAGYADTFPKVPNRDSSGTPIPANRAENRRVVINLEKVEKN
jgi:flagellar motor protein MotB